MNHADVRYTSGNLTLSEGDRVIVGIELPDERDERTLPPGFELGPKVK